MISGMRILAIEDDPDDVELLRRYLRDVPDLKLEFADRLSTGLKLISEKRIDLVLLDLGLPASQGLETLTRFLSQVADIPVVVMTDMSDETLGVEAVRMGAQDYLVKGAVDTMLLVRSIRYAVERKQMEVALVKARDELEKRVEERTSELLTTNIRLQSEIAERQRAGEDLKQSEARFRAVIEGARDLIFLKDLSLRYTHVNPAVEKFLGIPSSEILGRRAETFFGEETGKRIRDCERRVLRGQSIDDEYTGTFKGVLRTFHEVRVPLKNSMGEIIGICSIARDVTERKNVGQARTIMVPENYPSAAMQKALREAHYASATDTIVLLQGESGSGKDYLARWIHDQSRRSSGSYFSVNCAAIPKELAESELFGHEAGAFTGASGRKRGLLELAEGGTLLLNEIGELPLSLQSKLLTFLDSKSFLRVGGDKSIHVNARLIAATHRNLEAEVAEGRFLSALFYRLNVFSIGVPPLRDRVEDIPVLAEEILSALGAEQHVTQAPAIDPTAMNRLMRYNWPGNVRELRNVLERALMSACGDLLTIVLPSQDECSDAWSHNVLFTPGRTLHDITDEVTQSFCEYALQRSGGSRQEAARLLDISRTALYRYMKRWGTMRENETQD